MKVKAKTFVRYKGETIPAGRKFEITAEDYKLHANILEVMEGDTPKQRKLTDLKVDELKALAEKFEIEGFEEMKKADLIAVLESYDLTGLL